jgi:hypothetical protein
MLTSFGGPVAAPPPQQPSRSFILTAQPLGRQPIRQLGKPRDFWHQGLFAPLPWEGTDRHSTYVQTPALAKMNLESSIHRIYPTPKTRKYTLRLL